MRIAYLTNQYPHVRHTFIRREIVALEAHGVDVLRFSMRDTSKEIVDPADKDELSTTRAILSAGKMALPCALFGSLVQRPGRFISALRTAFRLGRRSGSGVLRHIV
jgi:hypothetical protein